MKSNTWLTITLITTVALLCFTLISLGYYLGAGSDDDFISLWTGKTLAVGQGLVNHNGQRVEIGSSLLHTFILAGFYLAAPDLAFTLNKLSGFLAGALTILLLVNKRKILFRQPEPWNLVALAGAVFSLTFAFLWGYWNLGGQETPFHVLILFIYAILLLETWEQPQRAWWLGIVQILYILVRAEGVFFILPFTLLYGLAYRWLKQRSPNWKALLVMPLIFSLALFIARYAWSGYWLPSPSMAKTGLDLASRWNALKNGLKGLFLFYIWQAGLVNLLLGAAAVGGLFSALRCAWQGWRQRVSLPLRASLEGRFPLLCLPLLILWNHLMILAIGIGIGMRFVLPVMPLLAAYGSEQITLAARIWLAPRVPRAFSKGLLPGLGLLVILLPAAYFFTQITPHNPVEAMAQTFHRIDLSRIEESLILLNTAHQRDVRDILPFIENNLLDYYAQSGNRLTIATGQMGFFPYIIKTRYPDLNIRFIDVAGLADPVVANLDQVKGPVGVLMGARIELIMTGQAGNFSAYVLSQEPNMIYALAVDPAAPAILERAGWELVWQRPGGVVFYHPFSTYP